MTQPTIYDLQIGMISGLAEQVVGPDQIRQFANLTGDCDPIHVDDAYAAKTEYGRCIAHGVHILGLMSDRMLTRGRYAPNVSYGYDKVRFVRPLCAGETLITQSRVIEIKAVESKVVIEESGRTEAGDVVAIAHHIFKFI